MPVGNDGRLGGSSPIDWERDFPIQEEAEDHAGNVRQFEVTCHCNGLGTQSGRGESPKMGTATRSPPTARRARTPHSGGCGASCTVASRPVS